MGTNMRKVAEESLPEYNDEFIEIGNAEELFLERKFEKAREIYQSVSHSNLNESIKLYSLHASAMCELELSNFEAVEEILKELDSIQSDHPDTYYLRYQSSRKQQRYGAALEQLNPLLDDWEKYKWVSKLGLNVDFLLTETGNVLLEMGDLEGALQVF